MKEGGKEGMKRATWSDFSKFFRLESIQFLIRVCYEMNHSKKISVRCSQTPASQKPEGYTNQVYMNQTAGGKYTEASFTVTLN